MLSRYLQCPPGDIVFRINTFGKPFVNATKGSRPSEFNLSHARQVILVGVCEGQSVGIDVEEIRPSDDLLTIAESQFTPQESAFILAQPPARRARAFFRCWARKEAYVKVLGKGLSIQLNSFDTLGEPERPGPSSDTRFRSPDTPTLQIADLDVPEGYVASVAVDTGIDRVVDFEWK